MLQDRLFLFKVDDVSAFYNFLKSQVGIEKAIFKKVMVNKSFITSHLAIPVSLKQID